MAISAASVLQVCPPVSTASVALTLYTWSGDVACHLARPSRGRGGEKQLASHIFGLGKPCGLDWELEGRAAGGRPLIMTAFGGDVHEIEAEQVQLQPYGICGVRAGWR
ncbi:hypothetical protein B0T21DRAFT_87682 [Apiosordaria backusii]|uniref:Uncharacterized protein n=1 Tax=Apiosordaria backusii TaxID=314023 RepID=A0AA40K3A4_9PEZI|nr:hypothetical protein B0T21DRAFT_87682 [Apiosordaria backusii]